MKIDLVFKSFMSFAIGTTVLCSVGWGLSELVIFYNSPLYQHVEYLGKVESCKYSGYRKPINLYVISIDGSEFPVTRPFIKGTTAYLVYKRNGSHSIYNYNPLDKLESAVE